MLISPSFVAQRLRLRLRLWCTLCASSSSRLLHTPRKAARSFERFRPSQPPPSRNLSLLEELFPEDVQRDGGRDSRFHNRTVDVPRLALPEVDDQSERFEHDPDCERVQPKKVSETAAANAFRQQQLAVLSLGTASKSLIESDFRRIAPKGQHIDNWTGPGDILKSGSMEENITRQMIRG